MNEWSILNMVFPFAVPAVLVLLGLSAGTVIERNHFRRLEEREETFADMLVTDLKQLPGNPDPARSGILVTGEAVIGGDYLRMVLASLKNIFGGELGHYTRLMTRARREAVLRMLEQARARGYNAVGNVRLETVDISTAKGSGNQGMPQAVVLASGTAYYQTGKAPAKPTFVPWDAELA